jgi:3-methyladenine DNA glycosylase/8-oxoguanine DNA glycosylase
VRKALGRFYFADQTPAVEEVRAFAAGWGAFQSLAVHYLLAGLRFTDLTPGKPPAKAARQLRQQA